MSDFLGTASSRQASEQRAWAAWLLGPEERRQYAREERQARKRLALGLAGCAAGAAGLHSLPALHGATLHKGLLAGQLLGACKAKLAGLLGAKGAPGAAGFANAQQAFVANPLEGFSSFAEAWAHPRGKRRIICWIVAVVWFIGGIFAFKEADGLSAMAVIYSMVNIMLTVGAGDVDAKTPKTEVMFTLFIIIDMLFISNLLIDFLMGLTAPPEDKMKPQAQGDGGPSAPQRDSGQFMKMVQAIALFVAMIVVGGVINHWINPVNCPDGNDACVDDRDKGMGATEIMAKYGKDGAEMQRWSSSFYGAVGLISTIGCGTFNARSDFAKFMYTAYMIPAIMSMAVATIEFMSWATEHESAFDALDIKENEFQSLDKNHDNQIDRYEFLRYVLQRYQFVSEKDLDILDDHFTQMDVSGDGVITVDELRGYFKKPGGRRNPNENPELVGR